MMTRKSDALKHASRILDAREAEAVEKSVFGMTATEIEEQKRAEEEARMQAEAEKEKEEQEVPEANRLFDPPDPEQVPHLLRELEWGEQLVGTRMAAARGNNLVYMYSLQEAANFFLDERSGTASLGTNGAFVWIDLDTFLSWVRNTVGDVPLAEVLEEKMAEREDYNDKLEALRHVFSLRMSQYAPYLQDA